VSPAPKREIVDQSQTANVQGKSAATEEKSAAAALMSTSSSSVAHSNNISGSILPVNFSA
jgi:hypothetical protein